MPTVANVELRKPTFISAAAFALMSLIEVPASGQPIELTNLPTAKWEFIRQEGDRHCMLRTAIPGRLPKVDLDRSLGGRKLQIFFRGLSTGQPYSTFAADYVIGSSLVGQQEISEADMDDDLRRADLEFVGPEAAAIARGSALTVTIASEEVVRLNTKGIVRLLPALERCNRDHLVELGADPQMVAKVAVSPWAEDSALFTTNDYPAVAIRNGEQGTTVVIATVSPTGDVRDCRVVRSSKSESLDRATCDTLMRRKYSPGLDASGKPVDSPTTLRLNWILPG